MPSPRHLWSGSWRQESQQHTPDAPPLRPTADAPDEPLVTQAPPEVYTAPPPRPPAPAGPRPSRRPIAAAAAAVIVGASAAGYLIGHDGNSNDKASTSAALPALPSSPVSPKKGLTRAGTIYANASPAVVSIRNSTGSGTGFLVTDTRTVATNAHVVEGSSTVTVRFGSSGRDISGQVLGVDASSDLAVVRLPAGSAPSGAKPLQLADSSQVHVGDQVVAIGNPFGLDRTLTEGIISALGRAIQAPNNYEIDDALQTDAAINPGNSGGPLLDSGGRVIGVNSQIETGSGSNGNVGIGFAVSSNTVRQVVPALAKGRTIARAWLGISSQPSATGTGATLTQINPGGPAQEAGLQAGDVALTIDGQIIRDFSDISRAVNSHHPGDRIKVQVRRAGGSTQTVTVTLGTRPAGTP